MRRGMQILEKFVEIQKNEKVDDFFTKNGFWIFLQVILPIFGFDRIDPTEEPYEYVQELNEVCCEQEN
jgi:hypothetical protein